MAASLRIGDHSLIFAGTIPFEHGEFGMMDRGALAVAEDMGELENARQPRRQQFFHRKFRRCVEIERPAGLLVGGDQFGGEGHQMRLQPRADLQGRRFNLEEVPLGEEGPCGGGQARTQFEHRTAAGEDIRPPPGWRGGRH
jgi:hypothetical protein